VSEATQTKELIRYCQWTENQKPGAKVTKDKAIPIQALTGPQGSRRLRFPEFLHNWHMKVKRFSALNTDHLYSPGGNSWY
jgi:hypothetical protein